MNTFNEVVDCYAAQIRSSDVIEIEDIPNIDLYMDQVTTFMDKGLAQYLSLIHISEPTRRS